MLKNKTVESFYRPLACAVLKGGQGLAMSLVEKLKGTMIKNRIALVAAACAVALAVQQAGAAPIVGTIAIEGGADLDSNDLGTATKVEAWDTPEVTSVSGDFDTFVDPEMAVSMTAPWTFTSGLASLWSVGGYTFDLTTSSITFQNSSFLLVEGTGTASGHGFDDTIGTFRFSTQEPDAMGVFSFSASVGTVPEGGTTAMLLGLGFLGLGAIRRKLS